MPKLSKVGEVRSSGSNVVGGERGAKGGGKPKTTQKFNHTEMEIVKVEG